MPVLGVGTTAHSKNLSDRIIRDLASQPLTKPYSHESRFKAPFTRKGKGRQSPSALERQRELRRHTPDPGWRPHPAEEQACLGWGVKMRCSGNEEHIDTGARAGPDPSGTKQRETKAGCSQDPRRGRDGGESRHGTDSAERSARPQNAVRGDATGNPRLGSQERAGPESREPPLYLHVSAAALTSAQRKVR